MSDHEVLARNRFLGSMLCVLSLAEEKLGSIELFSIKDLDENGRLQFKITMDGTIETAMNMENTLKEYLGKNLDIEVSKVQNRSGDYVVLVTADSTDWDRLYFSVKEAYKDGGRSELFR